MENEEELVVFPHVEDVEKPQSVSTDMVDLLVMVVDWIDVNKVDTKRADTYR